MFDNLSGLFLKYGGNKINYERKIFDKPLGGASSRVSSLQIILVLVEYLCRLIVYLFLTWRTLCQQFPEYKTFLCL